MGGSERTSVGGDPAIDGTADKTAENRKVEEGYHPPHSRYARHDKSIGLESRQRAAVRENKVERLFQLRVVDDRGRSGAKVTRSDLLQAIEGKKPSHGPHAEAAAAIINHFHVTHALLPDRTEAIEPDWAQKAHVPHDHDE